MPNECARTTRVSLFESHAPVDLLSAAYVTHRFTPHAHEEVAVGVIEGGAVRTRVGTRTIVVPDGWIIALNPGEVHTGEPVDASGYRYRMYYMNEALFRLAAGWPVSATAGDSRIFTSAAIHDPGLAARLVRVHVMLEGGADRFLAQSAFVDVMGELAVGHGSAATRNTPPRPHADVVRTVREYLEAEYTRVVTLAELSTLTGLSPFHVSRIFRASVGLPPYAFLALVRVRRARALIQRGVPLATVTHEAGFADQAHFTRQFKRVVGVPPGQYARDIARSTIALRLSARASNPSHSLLGPSTHHSPRTRVVSR